VIRFRKEYAAAKALYAKTGAASRHPPPRRFYHGRALQCAAAGAAVRAAADGRDDRALWRLCDAIETRGSAAAALVLIAAIYSVWRPSDLAPILKSTIRDSTMLMMIIGVSLLYTYVMSYLHISQSAAESIVAMHLPRWKLLAAILVMWSCSAFSCRRCRSS